MMAITKIQRLQQFICQQLKRLVDIGQIINFQIYYAGSATEFEEAILTSNYNGKDGRYDNESLWNANIHVLDESDNWILFDKNAFFVDHPTE